MALPAAGLGPWRMCNQRVSLLLPRAGRVCIWGGGKRVHRVAENAGALLDP